jgi:hypothetical protein
MFGKKRRSLDQKKIEMFRQIEGLKKQLVEQGIPTELESAKDEIHWLVDRYLSSARCR